MAADGLILSPVGGHIPFSAIRLDEPQSPTCPSDSILIYLAVPGEAPKPIRVFDSDSVQSVKLRIQHFKGFVVNKQRLVFEGRELTRDNCLIKDYGLDDGKVLHLVLRLSDLRRISVETTDGKQLEFRLEVFRNIGDVKKKIAAKQGVDIQDIEEQKLVFDGEELEDHQLIMDISKNADAVIHLLIRKPVKVRTQAVGSDTELTVIAPERNRQQLVLDSLKLIPKTPISRLVEPIIVNPKVEIGPAVLSLIDSTIAGLEKGYEPVICEEGSGGVYFMRGATGKKVGVFKPMDEEPMTVNNPKGFNESIDGEGLKRGTRPGEGALREVAAYVLDHPIGGRHASNEVGFSGVPPTFLVQYSAEKTPKIGSLQMFVENSGSCEDMGPRAFPVREVHKIAVLDIRLANADRHAGNMLVHQEADGSLKLLPIDHGYCLPEKFEDCTFEWLYWPQAREPFSAETLEYIKSLNAEEDIALLKFHGWELSPECARVFRISTMVLKIAAGAGRTAFDVGSFMSRANINKLSKIETILEEAEDSVLPGSSEECFLETVSELVARHFGGRSY